MNAADFHGTVGGQEVGVKSELLDEEDIKPCISNKRQRSFGSDPFSDDEERSIRQKLDVGLSREETAQRPGPGGVRLTYIEGWKVIHDANQIFGFNGWSSHVRQLDLRFVEERHGRFSACVSATVRITLRDGAYREDRGGGSADNMRSKGDAILKAEKEAVTDATKRALKNFGLRLGLSLYDRQHVREMNRPQPRVPAREMQRPSSGGMQTPMAKRSLTGGMTRGPVHKPASSPVTPAGPRQGGGSHVSPKGAARVPEGSAFAAQREQAIQRKQAFLARQAQENAAKAAAAANAQRAQQAAGSNSVLDQGAPGVGQPGHLAQRPSISAGGSAHMGMQPHAEVRPSSAGARTIAGSIGHGNAGVGQGLEQGTHTPQQAGPANRHQGNRCLQGSGSSGGSSLNNSAGPHSGAITAMRQREIDELSRMALADF